MSHRRISGLIEARQANANELPVIFTRRRRASKSAKGQGIRFEKDLAAALEPHGWQHGVWFKFVDAFGKGLAQPDLFLVAPAAVYVIEAKLGNVEAGLAQFAELYRPLLEHVFRRPAFGIVAARYLGAMPAERPRVATDLGEALERSRTGAVVLLWRKGYPLMQKKAA